MSPPETESFVAQFGHGSISTGSSAFRAASDDTGMGIGTGTGTDTTATGSVSGMTNSDWHFGHLPDFPARLSSTVKVAAHPGHANRIIAPRGKDRRYGKNTNFNNRRDSVKPRVPIYRYFAKLDRKQLPQRHRSILERRQKRLQNRRTKSDLRQIAFVWVGRPNNRRALSAVLAQSSSTSILRSSASCVAVCNT